MTFSIRSEVDPTGSLWYTQRCSSSHFQSVLKLTLPGHYGILRGHFCAPSTRFWSWPYRVIMVYFSSKTTPRCSCSEVDPTGSLWYNKFLLFLSAPFVLKLTLPGHYGILGRRVTVLLKQFWSWPYRVIMVYIHLWGVKVCDVLKLTLPGHYGIQGTYSSPRRAQFWSWPYRVIMV